MLTQGGRGTLRHPGGSMACHPLFERKKKEGNALAGWVKSRSAVCAKEKRKKTGRGAIIYRHPGRKGTMVQLFLSHMKGGMGRGRGTIVSLEKKKERC